MTKHQAKYVDGFVLVVPNKSLAAYKQMAKRMGKVWRKHGALDYKECVGDDLKPQWGVPFPKLMRLARNETAVFSYITYRSRAHRDRVNRMVMKDPAMDDPKYKDRPMPFDVKRMAYGGFKVVVDL